jgi:hypothetical protein
MFRCALAQEAATMNRRVGMLGLALGALLLAAPAAAQVQTRDHRKQREEPPKSEVVKARRGGKARDPITVTSYDPRSGPIGSLVTIRGTGFSPRIKVIFGGTAIARPRTITDTELTVEVPRRAGDGSIVLRERGSDDVPVGTFELVADPDIARFAPPAGPAGTKVEIFGTGFRNGDQVLMNGRPLTIEVMSPTRIVAVIPPNASTDHLVVQRPNGPSAKSSRKFEIDMPAPVITSLAPSMGPPGTVVRINGQHFGPHNRVFYGSRRLAVRASSPTWFEVVVPENARVSDYFHVRSRRGEARSPQRFEIEAPLVVTRVSPESVVVGERIEIYGQFRDQDRVTLDGKPLQVIQIRPGQITAQVGPGATSGSLAVERGGARVAYPGRIEVLYPPVVRSFSPTSGDAGTVVTIAGEHFAADSAVYYGARRIQARNRRPTSIEVTIPGGAKNDKFKVRTRAGDAISPTEFRVQSYSALVSVQPKAAPVGARIALIGRDFDPKDRFWVGDTELTVQERQPNRVFATIPNGARSGKLSWESWGKRFESRVDLEILDTPTIASFAPTAGPPRTQVTITGDYFTRTSTVYFGQTEIPVVKRALPKQLVVRLPDNAVGSEYLFVDTAGARVRSQRPFEVVPMATISGFSPDAGKPGTEVTISGSEFRPSATVRLDDQPVEIIRRDQDKKIVVRIPPNAKPGKRQLIVDMGGTVSRAPGAFHVLPYAAITRVDPPKGAPGAQIDLYGSWFGADTKIFYGDVELQVIRIGRKNEMITVKLPANPKPRAYFWADDNGHRARSPSEYEIDAGRPAEVVPAKRGKKPGSY